MYTHAINIYIYVCIHTQLIYIYIYIYFYMYTHVIYKLIFPKTICDMMFMFNHVYDTMLISWFVAIPIMDCENLHYIG